MVGNVKRVQLRLMISPFDSRRNMRRSSKYSCAFRRASVMAASKPHVRSFSSKPSSTRIVELKDERMLGGAEQFHPPSSSLFAQKTIHDVLAPLTEITAEGKNRTVDARFRLAVEVRTVVERLPFQMLLHARNCLAGFATRRIQTHFTQQRERIHSDHPAGLRRAAKPAMWRLPIEQGATPTFPCHTRSLRRDADIGLARKIAQNLPANRRIAVQKPARNACLAHLRLLEPVIQRSVRTFSEVAFKAALSAKP